jgi:pyruvate-formate lyase-activating enzyme
MSQIRLDFHTEKMDRFVTALVANEKGEFFELDGYAAVGMAGSRLVPLTAESTINMPFGSEYMFLPKRRPIVYDKKTGQFEVLVCNPHAPGEDVFPVSSFNAPGYTICLASAYVEVSGAGPLPLFSYGAVGWLGKGGRVAAVRVDWERRQDLRLMPLDGVRAGVSRCRRLMPTNRLCRHLETCALVYGCPAAKNFFLGRYEAPLPTSTRCNARCWGCLSLQRGSGIPSTQERITFTPTPDEIAEVAIYHIKHVNRAVVSFGQGCEGDPLLAAEVIGPAVRRIRRAVGRAGTINMNTNASLPHVVERLLDAGLDSIRVSMNSVRRPCYEAYFRPKGYRFSDVVDSVNLAGQRGKFVSINYLSLPGFTDGAPEVTAFLSFLEEHPVSMIQWRNLNFDPLRYRRIIGEHVNDSDMMGISALLEKVRAAFPRLKSGYFNPPKEKFKS